MTKEWNRLDANGNGAITSALPKQNHKPVLFTRAGLVSGAEVDTWVQQHHKPLRLRAVIKQVMRLQAASRKQLHANSLSHHIAAMQSNDNMLQAVLQTLKGDNGHVAE